jgi:hypothetical protein
VQQSIDSLTAENRQLIFVQTKEISAQHELLRTMAKEILENQHHILTEVQISPKRP